ncbi:DUF3992 domain-containing protein [Cytobacillus sp. Hm23]
MSNCCCPDRGDEFFKDELCGNYTIECGESEIIWTTENEAMETFPVTGSVTVFLDRGCGDLTVELLLGGEGGSVVKMFDISPVLMGSGNNGNSMSTTQIGFDTVRLTCSTGMGAACRGKYCLCINYEAVV